MVKRMVDRFKFYLERHMLRGARFQLLFIAVIIIIVSIVAGALVFIFAKGFSAFGEAIWWAFLRLTDPGYLGDDEGLIMRTVSTIVTVLGYVFFMGALIAIMTQWLNSTMKKLESGLTPITQKNHIIILGWTNRTLSIVRELMVSQGRVKRFLRRIGAGKLHVVILADEVTTAMAFELRAELGSLWNDKQIILRSGNPLHIEHLRRIDFKRASVIIIPGADFIEGGSEVIDTKTVKTLLSISNYGEFAQELEAPLVVAELFDVRKIPIVVSAFKGEIENIASDSLISRLLTQNVRHRGLSHIYTELLTHNEGNEIYIRELPQLVGLRLQDLIDVFPGAILLGALREDGSMLKPLLNPADGVRILDGDKLVLMAKGYNDTEPLEDFEERVLSRSTPKVIEGEKEKRRLLFLGWNRKVSVLFQEFASYSNERFSIDVLSLFPIPQREDYLKRYELDLHNITVRHLHGDYTAMTRLNNLDLGSYDNILFLSSDSLESGEESDARTILGYLLLHDLLQKGTRQPEILIELMDPTNEKIFQKRAGEVIISPLILSHILAHVALRWELNAVFDELFTTGGAEIYFRPVWEYGLEKREVQFRDIRKTVAQKGDTALGIKTERGNATNGGIVLNPNQKSSWQLSEQDEIVVLTTYM